MFRDQTILQFGEGWELLASLVLLNPGSALPRNGIDQAEFLRSKSLPYFVAPLEGETYLEFSIDRLMNDVVKLFSSARSGGTIRLHNLFNLKNQHSSVALAQMLEHQFHPKLFSIDAEINFCDAPVVTASGGAAASNIQLRQQLVRHISAVPPENLYRLARDDKGRFSVHKAEPDDHGFVASYHPSYTCKYGNRTTLGELAGRMRVTQGT